MAPEVTAQLSVERLEEILRHLPMAFYCTEPHPPFRIRYGSQNLKALLGYDPSDYVGVEGFWLERVHPDDVGRIMPEVMQLRYRDSVVIEYRFRRKDGEYIRITDIGTIVRGADGQPREMVGYFMAANLEVSAIAGMRHLVERLQLLESIVNRSPAMVFRWKVAEGWPVEFVSENVSQLGYAAEDFLTGKVSWPGITHPDDVPRLETEVAGYLERGLSEWSQEYRLKSADGAWRWIEDRNRVMKDEAGNITHIEGIAMDVTQRHTAERTLAESEARYRSLVENHVEALCCWLPDTTITFANESYSALFGLHAADVTGRRWLDLLPEHAREAGAATARAILAARTLFTGAGAMQPPGGPAVWMEWTSSPVFGPDGTLVEIQSIGRDISARRAMDETVARVARMDRDRLRRDLHDTVCQDMTGIVLLAETLARRMGAGDARCRELAEEIGRTASGAVVRLREVARSLAPNFATPDQLLAALEELAARIEALHGIHCRFDANPDLGLDDPTVLSNLYLIAQEAALNAARHGQPSLIRMTLERTDGRCLLRVSDDGVPRAPEGGQNGMGLAIMRERAALIGWSLSIARGQGTRVECLGQVPGRQSASEVER